MIGQNMFKNYYIDKSVTFCIVLQRVNGCQPVWYVGLRYQSLAEESISYHTVTSILSRQLTQFTHCCMSGNKAFIRLFLSTGNCQSQPISKHLSNILMLLLIIGTFLPVSLQAKRLQLWTWLDNSISSSHSNKATVFVKNKPKLDVNETFLNSHPPAKAGERHHHRRVVTGPLQHGEGAADLRAARHGRLHQVPGGAWNAAFQPRTCLLLCQGQRVWRERENTYTLYQTYCHHSDSLVSVLCVRSCLWRRWMSNEHKIPTHSHTLPSPLQWYSIVSFFTTQICVGSCSQALEAVNTRLRELYPESEELFDVVLMTNNHAYVGLRLINTINHHRELLIHMNTFWGILVKNHFVWCISSSSITGFIFLAYSLKPQCVESRGFLTFQ